MTPSVTVHVVPDPVTVPTVGVVPPMPLPAFTAKLASVTPKTLSLNVTVKTSAFVPVVNGVALPARTIELTVGAVLSIVKPSCPGAFRVFPAVSVAPTVALTAPLPAGMVKVPA